MRRRAENASQRASELASTHTAPTRTCIATRAKAPDHQLLRVTLELKDGQCVAVPDPRRRAPGRGAWLTPSVEALETALQRRAFQRAFKVSTPVDAGPVRKYLSESATYPCKEDRTLMSTT